MAELDRAALVGMDGFHIGDAELRRTGLRDRKGAPETFDRAGYRSLLRRLRSEAGVVYVPVFDRSIEDSIAAALAVPPETRLIVTEGNYLLHWPEIRPLLDEVWYLDPPREDRLSALVDRHLKFGRTPDQAPQLGAGIGRAQRRARRGRPGRGRSGPELGRLVAPTVPAQAGNLSACRHRRPSRRSAGC